MRQIFSVSFSNIAFSDSAVSKDFRAYSSMTATDSNATLETEEAEEAEIPVTDNIENAEENNMISHIRCKCSEHRNTHTI